MTENHKPHVIIIMVMTIMTEKFKNTHYNSDNNDNNDRNTFQTHIKIHTIMTQMIETYLKQNSL